MSNLAHLTLIGCGLRALDHLTREADRCLRAARVVFHSVYSRDLLASLRDINPGAEFVAQEDGEYFVGQYRPDMYRRIAERALAEARRGPGVVVLHPGSVMVVDAIARQLVAAAADSGIQVEILPGVSSVEFVLAEMGWDVAGGTQVILAQNLVLHGRRLDPTQAAIVLQPGYYDTLWFAGAPLSRPGRFDVLTARLSLSYPDDAPMALVLAPIARHENARVTWFRLGGWSDLGDAVSPLHTLFIPPLSPPPNDEAFARRVGSWDDLVARVRTDDHGVPKQADPRTWWVAEPTVESEALASSWPRRRRELLGEGA